MECEPVLDRLQGSYRYEVRTGILMPAPYSGLWGFCEPRTGEVWALVAEYEEWLSLIPAPLARRFSRAEGASQFDIPQFMMGGLPVIMTRQSVSEGLIAPALVAVHVCDYKESI